nr:MAG TPA: hypothetical protein [Caudoviricetes sp.]
MLLSSNWNNGTNCSSRSANCNDSSANVNVNNSSRSTSDTWVILKQVRLTLG